MEMDTISKTEMINALKGVNGQIELYGDKIIIKRNGITAKLTQGFFKGDKTIYINQISGVELRLGGSLVNGYIQFTIPGGIESRGGLTGKNGAVHDENTVMFIKKYNSIAEEIKSYVERRISGKNQHTTGISGAGEIRRYKQLLDDGIITSEEYELKKKEILRTM